MLHKSHHLNGISSDGWGLPLDGNIDTPIWYATTLTKVTVSQNILYVTNSMFAIFRLRSCHFLNTWLRSSAVVATKEHGSQRPEGESKGTIYVSYCTLLVHHMLHLTRNASMHVYLSCM